MKISFIHVNLVAENWKKLADFYIEVFGCIPKPPERNLSGEWLDSLTSIKNSTIRGMHLILPGFGADGPTIEIFEYDVLQPNDHKQTNTSGFAHIAFNVEDVEACLDSVIKAGGSAVGKTIKTEINGVGIIHVVYAKDPEGNIIELQSRS